MYSTAAMPMAPVSMPPQGVPTSIPMSNIPQPSPPSGWTLTKSESTIKEGENTVSLLYEFAFAAPEPGKKGIPGSSSVPRPVIPFHWVIVQEKLSIERKEDKTVTYKYDLSYSAPK
jgi:hypothetical protein